MLRSSGWKPDHGGEELATYESQFFPVRLVYARQGLLPLKARVSIDWTAPRLKRALKNLAAPRPAEERPGE